MSLRSIYERPWALFCFYLVSSLLVRVWTYFPSVINHDESIYIVIAQAILAGDVYWVDVIDTKPIGIFLLFALIQSFFGKTILAIRLCTSFVIAGTAYILNRTHRKIGGDDSASFSTGIMYIAIVSFFTFFGLSPNTEHFFVLPTIAALYLIWNQRQWGSFLLAGLLLGIGFVIKPVVLFDMIALGTLVLFQNRSHPVIAFRSVLIMATAGVFPFLCVLFYYNQIDALDVFQFYTFEVGSNYLISQPLSKTLLFIADFFLRFLPVSFWFIFCLLSKSILTKEVRLFIVVWGIFIWVGILLPGKLFSHYTIQFMLPYCLVAGSFFDLRRHHHRFWQFLFKPIVGYSLLLLLITGTLFQQFREFIQPPDTPRIVSNYLKQNLTDGNIVYTGDAPHIIYLLIDQKSPIKYVHRSLLWDKNNADALKINPGQIKSEVESRSDVKYYLFERLEAAYPNSDL